MLPERNKKNHRRCTQKRTKSKRSRTFRWRQKTKFYLQLMFPSTPLTKAGVFLRGTHNLSDTSGVLRKVKPNENVFCHSFISIFCCDTIGYYTGPTRKRLELLAKLADDVRRKLAQTGPSLPSLSTVWG